MKQLQRADLWSLEDYAEHRPEFRRKVLAHKQSRRVNLGENLLILFEDELTIRYQIQEMLRIEKVFEAAAIQEELDAYNPLIPDGSNFKCTMLIQYGDTTERKQQLSRLIGIEDKVWIKIGATDQIFPVADEDMQRSNHEKTSAVHFMRYPLNPAQVDAAKSGSAIVMGVAHRAYACDDYRLPTAICQSLIADLL